MKKSVRTAALAALGCVTLSLSACSSSHSMRASDARDPANDRARSARAEQPAQAALGKADPQMKAVLDTLQSLNPKPIEQLSPEEARQQPSPADAAKKLMAGKGMNTDATPVGDISNKSIPGPGGNIPLRVYTPKGSGPFPAILYIHGGGWVIASLDTYDASARALCNGANAVVVSVEYRHAPENKFPAAHDDTFAAYQWLLQNAADVKADPKRVAVAGESAGGNMAAAICLQAKQKNLQLPAHQLLVYPVAGHDFTTPSYQENANAKPLNKAMMQWFFDKYLTSPGDAQDKRIDLVAASKQDLAGLPPATVITAQIDPLRSEGKQYADNLQAAGVDVAYRNYDGVTHEFFGLGAVVDKAKAAEQFATDRLKASLSK